MRRPFHALSTQEYMEIGYDERGRGVKVASL